MVREVPLMVAHGPETLATLRAEWPAFALSIALGTSINYLQFMLIQVLFLGSASAFPSFSIDLDISYEYISLNAKHAFSKTKADSAMHWRCYFSALFCVLTTGAWRRRFESDVYRTKRVLSSAQCSLSRGSCDRPRSCWVRVQLRLRFLSLFLCSADFITFFTSFVMHSRQLIELVPVILRYFLRNV